jgi:hypothetical protein
MSDPLPAGTKGTEQQVEVKSGAQTHDFALEAPAEP